MGVGRRGPARWAATLLVAGGALHAPQAGQPHFERIGPHRGLMATEIRAVYQDATGFLWLGTNEGLILYDGYGFKTFDRNVDDAHSLSDNQVRAILEDRRGRLWVGTAAGGLDVLDRANSRFSHHRYDESDPSSIPDDGVFALLQDRSGAIWVGTQRGLARFDSAADRFEQAEVRGWVIDLLEDREGDLWVATFGDGVFVRMAGASVFRPVEVANVPPAFRPRRARCLAQDAFGTVWAGVAGGLLRFDRRTAAFYGVEIPVGPGAPGGLPTASDLASAADGTLWVATPGGGLIAMDPKAATGVRYAHELGEESSLSSDNVQCLFLGRDGTLWIGAGDGTLNRRRRDAGLFTVWAPEPEEEDFGFANQVVEDSSGRIWVGSFGQGVTIFDPASRSVRRALAEPGGETGERTVVSLFPSRAGGAWVGTTVGLALLSAEGRVEHWWKSSPATEGSLGRGYVSTIYESPDGTVWVGTQGSGLFRMREGGSAFDAFPQTSGGEGLGDDYVTCVIEDHTRTLWIGTRSRGVAVFPRGASAPRHFLDKPGDLDPIAPQKVSSIVEDRKGRIWIGTQGGGLFRIDRDASGARVSRVDGPEGLENSNVAGVVEDDDGSLWVATGRGLARFDPGTGGFATWGIDDGLPSPAVRQRSVWRGRTSLYFGMPKGVVSVPRGTPFPSPEPSAIALTSLRTLDGPVPAARPAWDLDRISIRHGDALFVDFSLLDFRGVDRHRFAYRIGGNSAAWVDVGNRRGITFTNLDAGEHVLRVRGRNANGVWSETAKPLTIRVVPPFWRTAWFRIASLLVVAGMAWTGHRVRTGALERRNRVLEALQEEKQKALDDARASQAALHGAYDRLRSLTRRLEEAKEEERTHLARELHDEMGQALSATKINLKAFGRLPDGPSRAGRVADTLTLVDGMISRVRALSLDLRPPLLEELGLVAALRSYAEAQSMRTGLRIAVEANVEALHVPKEIAIAAFRFVQEGVHNALRHAGAETLTVSVRRDRGTLSLAVRDDGRGFDVAEALARAAKGGHLGLMGMRERFEALGGSFQVDAFPGKGTELRASVPLEPERGGS